MDDTIVSGFKENGNDHDAELNDLSKRVKKKKNLQLQPG